MAKVLKLRFPVLTHTGVFREPPCHNLLDTISWGGVTMCWDRKVMAGCRANLLVALIWLSLFFSVGALVMNLFRVTLLSTCQGSNSLTQCGISNAGGIWANRSESVNREKLYSLAMFMNSHCDLRQSESISKTVRRLWADLVRSLISFSGTSSSVAHASQYVVVHRGTATALHADLLDKPIKSALTQGPQQVCWCP